MLRSCLRFGLFASFSFTAPFAGAASVRDTRVLFHAGDRSILRENVTARTVPQAAWDQFIMGKTHFDLPGYRKGLYGAESIAGTSLYSLYRFLDGGDGWVMKIDVAPECVTKEAMQVGGYTLRASGAEPGRFAKWYAKNRARYRKLEKACVTEYQEFSDWHEGILYDLKKAKPAEIALSNKCTAVLNDFLNEEKLKIVYDAVNPTSWYLRDRACIADIKGSPDDLFALILEQRVGDPDEDFIRNFWGGIGEPGTYFAGSTLLLFNVVAETSLLNEAASEKLTAVETELSAWIGDFDEKARALSLDQNEDNVVIARHLLRAVRGAIESGRTAELQASLKKDLVELRKAFKLACEGKFGIPAAKVESCARATEAQTALLLRHLASFK